MKFINLKLYFSIGKGKKKRKTGSKKQLYGFQIYKPADMTAELKHHPDSLPDISIHLIFMHYTSLFDTKAPIPDFLQQIVSLF